MAASSGIAVRALSPMLLAGGRDRGLLLGYSQLPLERIDEAVESLARVIGRDGG
jgi:DNA-binding transcriptional MocR family regulator